MRRTIETLAEALQHRFEPLARDLGETLLQLSFVKIKAMREPADACMKTIVHSTDHGYKHLLILLLERAMGSSRNGTSSCMCTVHYLLCSFGIARFLQNVRVRFETC